MPSYYDKKKWIHTGFRKSNTKNKKYDAVLEERNVGHDDRKVRVVPFGDSRYQQYKDSTGQGLYTHMNHKNKKRREAYRKRHKGYIKPGFYSASEFSYKFLW